MTDQVPIRTMRTSLSTVILIKKSGDFYPVAQDLILHLREKGVKIDSTIGPGTSTLVWEIDLDD